MRIIAGSPLSTRGKGAESKDTEMWSPFHSLVRAARIWFRSVSNVGFPIRRLTKNTSCTVSKISSVEVGRCQFQALLDIWSACRLQSWSYLVAGPDVWNSLPDRLGDRCKRLLKKGLFALCIQRIGEVLTITALHKSPYFLICLAIVPLVLRNATRLKLCNR